jgi:hypothetical protein
VAKKATGQGFDNIGRLRSSKLKPINQFFTLMICLRNMNITTSLIGARYTPSEGTTCAAIAVISQASVSVPDQLGIASPSIPLHRPKFLFDRVE